MGPTSVSSFSKSFSSFALGTPVLTTQAGTCSSVPRFLCVSRERNQIFHPESSQSAGDKAWGTGRGSCGAEPGESSLIKKEKGEKKRLYWAAQRTHPPSLSNRLLAGAPVFQVANAFGTSCSLRENPAKLGSFEHQDLGSALELGWLRKPAVSCWLLPWGTQGISHASQSPDQCCSQRHPLLVSPAPPRTRLCLSSYTSSSLLEGAAGH